MDLYKETAYRGAQCYNVGKGIINLLQTVVDYKIKSDINNTAQHNV